MGRLGQSQLPTGHPLRVRKAATSDKQAKIYQSVIRCYEKQTNVRFETAHEVAISLAAAGISYEQQMADLAADIKRDRLTRSA